MSSRIASCPRDFLSLVAALLLLALLSGPPLFAADAPAFVVRTRLEPADAVAIGQQATLYVDAYTDLFFTSGIELPALDVPGAVIKLSDERPLHINDTIDGTSMFGIEHAYTITPIVGTSLTIPAFTVSAHAGPQSTPLAVTTHPLTLQVSVPAGAEDAFVTHDLTITQRTDVDVGELKAGDAFTRTIELTASGTPAMFIPDIDAGAATGLKAYPQPPSLTDSSPGQPVVGRRTFAVTYIVQQPLDVELPAVEVKWWDLDTGTAAIAQVPAIEVHAVAAPAPPAPFDLPTEEPVPPADKSIPWHLVLSVAAMAMAAVLLIRWLASVGQRAAQRLKDRLTARRRRYLDSEPHAFSELCSALHRDDPGAIAAALYRWLDRLPRSCTSQAPTVRDIGSPTALTRWLNARYSGEAPVSSSHLIDDLRDARRQLLRKACEPREERRLPALNP